MNYVEKLKFDDSFFEAEKIRLANKLQNSNTTFLEALEIAEDQLIITIENA